MANQTENGINTINVNSHRYRITLTLLLHWFAVLPAVGGEILEVQVDRDGPRYILVSTTVFDAAPEQIFRVLIDYDRLDEISETIKESRYLESDVIGQTLVFTRIGACVFFYCKTVEKTEQLVFTRPDFIQTTAIPERSNVLYSRSEWTLEASENGGTRVMFRLEFEPDFWVPPLLGPLVIKHALKADGASAVEKIDALAQELAASPVVSGT